MKSTRLILGLTALVVTGATAAHACQYCWSAAAEGADMAQTSMRMHGTSMPPGAFPLDGTINQFPAGGAPAVLSTPPPAGSVVTTAAGLRPAQAVLPPPVAAAARTAPVVAMAKPAPVVPPSVAQVKAPSVHWADAGLVSLAAAGGLFCWRTRRSPGAAS